MRLAAWCLAVAGIVVGPVYAQDTDLTPDSDWLSFGDPVDDAELDQATGRAGLVLSENVVNLNGDVSDNSVMNSVTGNNIISDHAFQNMSGVGTVVQNSGNNVLIQNSTVVNVILTE